MKPFKFRDYHVITKPLPKPGFFEINLEGKNVMGTSAKLAGSHTDYGEYWGFITKIA